jgi:Rod binding domain-containing protein
MGSPIMGGALASQAQTDLAQTREQHLLQQLKSDPAHNDDAKIDKAAKEFESILLGSWLQQAEHSMATVPGADEDDDSGGGQQMMSLGVQSLSTALSASGGIGIAKMLEKAMHAQEGKVQSEAQKGSQAAEKSKISGKQ